MRSSTVLVAVKSGCLAAVNHASWGSAGSLGRSTLPRHVVFLGAALILLNASPLLAAAGEVRFDTVSLVSCRDVTPDDFAAGNPHQRLVEGRFRVSALVNEADLPEGTQYVYRIVNPTGRLQIVDYRPKTRQSSAVVGNVSVEKKKESSKSLGVSLSGSFENLVRGTAGSDIGAKDAAQIKYELKPPMEVVLVAGTVERGTGVYFKLKPSPDTSLEGLREFVLVMRVSSSWRGDVMYVRCEAQQNRRGTLVSRGIARFVVGLHAEGDEGARSAAEELVLAEAHLRRTVAQRQREIHKRSIPTLVHKVGALLDVYDPRIPDSWLDRIIYGPTSIEQHDFYAHLPAEVRRVADQYQHAKRKMCQFNGGRFARHEQPLQLSAR